MQFQQDFYRIERKEHRDKNLWHFFFAIFAIFVVKFLWLRLAALGHPWSKSRCLFIQPLAFSLQPFLCVSRLTKIRTYG
jgi:hypothetical protein